jgi:PKD repeat protein
LAILWLWDFGDGNTSNEENPEHTYDQAGVYEVTLTIESATGCISSITEHVCVGEIVEDPDCTASFETFPIDSLTLQFEAQFETVDSALAVLWLWDFGDGNTSNEENPVHTYDQAGIYEVTLTIESATGCISSITEHVCVGEIVEDPDCSVEPQTTQLDSLTFSFEALSCCSSICM